MPKLTPAVQQQHDMEAARSRTTLDVGAVRNFIHKGRKSWEGRQHIVSLLSKDPAFDKSNRYNMSRGERYKWTFQMCSRISELAEKHEWSPLQTQMAMTLIDEPYALTLHELAFAPVFLSQASPQLLEKYGALVANRGIIGCYLQTELAHGSNVSALETTATYIPRTQEFEIHSPTLTSSKWWIGGLARSSTHGVVQAKLILPGGRDMGPHLFFIQLRSMEDHKVLPGITLGDIGPKAFGAYGATDNGYARFDHVRIPREYMLSKFAQVTEHGEYMQPPHAKMSYGGMLYIRSQMITISGWATAKAAVISIRYATVRRQGNMGKDGLETQVITYPSVYYRLLPILSRAYVLLLLGRHMVNAFSEMAERLQRGDTSLLAEVHATASGLKVWATTSLTQDIETARRSMGGHGFSAFAGLGRVYGDQVPSATFEGDNFVLDQQVERAAVKAYRSFSNATSAELTPSTAYLQTLAQGRGTYGVINWMDPLTCVDLLERRAAFIVRSHTNNLQSPDASAIQRVSKAVTEAFIARQVLGFIQDLPRTLPDKDAKIVSGLLTLFLLTTVESALTDLLSFGLWPQLKSGGRGDEGDDPTLPLRRAINQLLGLLLPESIGLTDAFGFTDWELDSALGVYDGRAYEALWERTKTEPLNNTEVPDGYWEYIRPIMERGQRLSGVKGAGAKL